MLTNYFPQRSGIVLNQLKAKALYPTSAVAPSFNQFGGNITNGFSLSMTAPGGAIYYTLDGSDPRLAGGAISSTALLYSGPINLVENATAKARVLNGGIWSALNEAPFVIIRDFTGLFVTEIMYHPPDEGEIDGEEFEFIELKNVATTNLDLSGIHFSDGIDFTFPNGTTISPGEFVVLVRNPTAFATKYPGVQVGGVYTGNLSNGGETLTMVHAPGAPLFSVNYSDAAPWATPPDGNGFSLVPQNANLNHDPNDAANWRASANPGGSPGADDLAPFLAPILINEVLPHTDPPLLDSVELFNPTTNSVDIGNWFLTDERTAPFKYRIPAGTMISAGGYRVFTEIQFNANPGSATNFLLNSHGEEIYLYSADVSGNLTGYSHGLSFGAAENGVSFGRYVTSRSESKYPAQISNTLGSPNSGPRVGPVVINEIRYHPLAGDAEFIELKNISGSPVKLYDPLVPANTWKLNGVGFSFPMNVELPAGGLLVLSATDPVAFRAANNVSANVPIFGPYSGVLQDNGELLQLQRPDKPDTNANNVVTVPYITVDEVRYTDQWPWPTNAANTGASLERFVSAAYGNDPINWSARLHTSSPGLENNQNSRPFVDVGPNLNLVSASFPIALSLAGTVIDDGLPLSPGAVTVGWSQLSGPSPVQFSPDNQGDTTASFPRSGTYVLRLSADDGALQNSSDVTVVIDRMTYPVSLISAGAVWKYLDTGMDQGSGWRALLFDDSSWNSGPAQLGYGDGDEATVVNSGPSGARIITTYFRRKFIVEDRASLSALILQLLRDDGGVVYLNGTEIFRSNMPAGAISYTNFSSEVVGGADESTFYSTPLSPGFLINGTNILAVEIHQANQVSTDLSFDLGLSGISIGTNLPPLVNAGTDFSIRLPQSAALAGSAQDDGLPLWPGVLSMGWSKVSGPGAVTFGNSNTVETSASFSADGVYLLQLAASDGANSASANVTVYVLAETYASWASANFSTNELANSGISGVGSDPDGDGFDNDKEFTAGTNPMDGRSYLQIESIQFDASANEARFRFALPARRSYSVQAQDALNGAWNSLTNFSAETVGRTVEISNPLGTSSRYYRLVAPVQP